MDNLYVKNPNYNPLDPRSQRYVTDTNAQTQAGLKAASLNDIFAPFTALANGLFKPYEPTNFYTPLPQNANVVQTSKSGTPITPTANFTSAQGANMTPLPTGTQTPTVPNTPQIKNTPTAVGGSYTIQAGDTLGAIAARNNTTVQAIAQANGIADPNKIQIGQVLKLSGSPTGANANVPTGNQNANVPTPTVPTGKLTTQEIANLAKQAGEAGMSAAEFMKVLEANSGASTTQVDEIRTKLGIPNLVDEAFKKPEKTTIDTYRELYDQTGLRDIQSKISAIDESINKKRADLVTATGALNSNPWVSQGTRQGRLKNLQELAYADINNDIERKNQYLDVYDKGVSEIEKQLGFITTDRAEARQLTVDQLNYALNEAERLQTGTEQDSVTAGLRNIPEFLKGTLNREATAQTRDLEKIAAQKKTTPSSSVSVADILQAGGASEALLQASVGGKATTDTFRTSYEKTLNTLYQLSDLSKAFDTYKENTGDKGTLGVGAGSELTGPIMGIIRSANPYDTKAQQIKAQLTALVPNLARGVYGEVGVLTDQDIALYSQTLPNLKSTKEVRDALLAITAKSVYRALENKLLVQAKGGVDVSGFATDLTQMRTLTDNLLTTAGVPTESPTTGGTNYSSADADYVKSLSL